MARGRMVSTTIGESRKFAALASNDHRLIYLMVLPHVDKAGRFEADPVVIKAKCLMRLDVDKNTIEAWLKDGVSTNLLRVYEANGIRYLEIVDFLKHNTPHHKEPDSDLPPSDSGTPCYTHEPDDGPSTGQASAKHEPSKAIREEKRRELEEEEKITLSSTETAPVPDEPVGQARRELTKPEKRKGKKNLTFEELPPDLAELATVYLDNRGRLPGVSEYGPDRVRKLERLRDLFNGTAKERLRDATLEVARDEFYIRKGYGLDILLAGDKVLVRSDAYREKQRTPGLDQYTERGL